MRTIAPIDRPKTADHPASPIRQHDALALAGYLFLRSALGRPVAPAQIARLRIADDCVAHTKATLHHGRGNVTTDLEKTGNLAALRRRHACRYTRLYSLVAVNQLRKNGMALKGNPMATGGAAFAMLAGAGNCGSHAAVTAAAHSARPPADRIVMTVRHQEQDHHWCEIRSHSDRPDPADIVADAWADGPAIEAADGAYTQNGKTDVLHCWTQADAVEVQALTRKFDGVRAQIDEQVVAHGDKPITVPGVIYTPENVLSSQFRQHARAVLDQPATQPGMPQSLHHAILAAGVARSLQAGVRDAAMQADSVIATASSLSQA